MGSPGSGYISNAERGVGIGLGAGLTGYGLSMNPDLPNVNLPSNAQDQSAIQNQQLEQGNLTDQTMQQLSQFYGGQNDQLNNQFKAQDQNLTNQLTSSDPSSLGGQLQGRFNNLGLLDSGAFNASLANQFSTLAGNQGIQAMQQNQTNTNSLADILGQNYQTQSGLGLGGLQRQFGLEDQNTNTQLAQNLARFGQQAGLQNSLITGGANTIGQSAGGGSGGGGK